MAYSSDFISIPLHWISYTYSGITYSYMASPSLQAIVDIIQAHWGVVTARVNLGERYFNIPILKNENLPCGFSWVTFDNEAYLVVYDEESFETRLIHQKGYANVQNMTLCMPNAQNFVLRTITQGFEYFVDIVALQDINSSTKAFSSFLITCESVGSNISYNNNLIAVSLSRFKDKVYTVPENTDRNYGIGGVYTSEGALRAISDAVLYTNYTVFESNNQLFFAPYDVKILDTPIEATIGGVEYVGFNFNPTVPEREPSWYKYNYYLRIQKED